MNPFVIDNVKLSLNGKKIILGVSGSIAAFKSVDLVRALKDSGAEVRVVLTESAERFVTAITLETLSGNPVVTSLWDTDGKGNHHIDLARWGDLMVIAPATANTIAKLANGIADNVLLTEYLAFDGDCLIAPSMNTRMLDHPTTQSNIRKLKRHGIRIIFGESGELSCGEVGLGRMAEVNEILETIGVLLAKPSGRKMLITNGPTQSEIDRVRYVTNHSSGRMGASIAWSAILQGWDVTIISGRVEVPYPSSAKVIEIKTADQMFKEVEREWSSHDVFVGASAVLDWDVKNPNSNKIKKGLEEIDIQWQLNPDILKYVGENRSSHQRVLGFAAESDNLVRYATQKLNEKSCDAIFANWIADAMGKVDSKGIWIDSMSNSIQFSHGNKAELARAIVNTLVSRWYSAEQAAESYENPEIYQ